MPGLNTLTTKDVHRVRQLIAEMSALGHWGHTDRLQSDDFDFFEIFVPNGADHEPLYSIGRCLKGAYVVLDHRRHLARFGRSLGEAIQRAGWYPEDDA